MQTAATVMCPGLGRYTRGLASATLNSTWAIAGEHRFLVWEVVFSKQSSEEPPLDFVPKLYVCGPRSRSTDKPIGSVTRCCDYYKHAKCEGPPKVCTITVRDGLRYLAPTNFTGDVWRYILVRMEPKKHMPPYGPLPAFLLTVCKTVPCK